MMVFILYIITGIWLILDFNFLIIIQLYDGWWILSTVNIYYYCNRTVVLLMMMVNTVSYSVLCTLVKILKKRYIITQPEYQQQVLDPPHTLLLDQVWWLEVWWAWVVSPPHSPLLHRRPHSMLMNGKWTYYSSTIYNIWLLLTSVDLAWWGR